MIKRFLTITMACLFLAACYESKIETDCSTISEDNAKRMDFYFQSCLLKDSAQNCALYTPRMFCERVIIEYNENHSVKSIQRLLPGIESLE